MPRLRVNALVGEGAGQTARLGIGEEDANSVLHDWHLGRLQSFDVGGGGGSRTIFPQFIFNNLPIFNCLQNFSKAQNASFLVQFWYSFRHFLRSIFAFSSECGRRRVSCSPSANVILAHIVGGGGEPARASFLPPNFRRCIQMADDAESCDQRK